MQLSHLCKVYIQYQFSHVYHKAVATVNANLAFTPFDDYLKLWELFISSAKR